jgi:hypothetical protein
MTATSGKSAWGALFVLLAAMAGAAPAAAQDKTYLEEYRAYTAALEAGDKEAAARHGYAAWQAAETELGEHELTAVLAYNYGQLVLFSDTQRAAEALKRASAIHQAGIAALPETELQLYLAFTDFALNKKVNRFRKNLRDALLAVEQEGVDPTPDIAAMWLFLASGDLEDRNYEEAKTNAAKAAAAIETAAPNQKRELASALLVRAVATILADTESEKGILEANRLLVDASRLFPVQESIETFDPMLGQIMAWNYAADALFHTNESYENYVGRATRIRLNSREDLTPVDDHGFLSFDYDEIFDKQLPMEECGIEWEERKPPSYPTKALNRGYVGAVMIGYHLEAGKVRNPIIISEVPRAEFGEVALKSTADWRLKKTPSDHPDCRENFVTSFSFMLRPN